MISKYIFLTATFFILYSNFLNYSYALTPDQILRLRKAGVSDETIHNDAATGRGCKRGESL